MWSVVGNGFPYVRTSSVHVSARSSAGRFFIQTSWTCRWRLYVELTRFDKTLWRVRRDWSPLVPRCFHGDVFDLVGDYVPYRPQSIGLSYGQPRSEQYISHLDKYELPFEAQSRQLTTNSHRFPRYHTKLKSRYYILISAIWTSMNYHYELPFLSSVSSIDINRHLSRNHHCAASFGNFLYGLWGICTHLE